MTSPITHRPGPGGATALAGHRPPPLGATAALVRRQRRRRQRRAVLVSASLAVLVVALFTVSLCVGERSYSPAEVLQVLLGHRTGGAGFVVGQLRLPRAATAILAGAAFGIVGTCFQTLLRNTLASPDIIGVTAGANTAAVAAIILLGVSGLELTAMAVAGGLVTALVVALLAWQGGAATSRLILVGIAAGAMFDAATLWIMTKGNQWDIQSASRWLTGSLNGATFGQLAPLAVVMVVCLPVIGALARHLDTLRLGNDTAAGLGVPVSLTRAAIMLLGVVVLATAIATTGPISFVSLLCGPIAAQAVGSGRSPLVPAALVGSALVLASDLIAQHAFSHSYPVGVVTGLVGGLYLIVLIVRLGRRAPG